MIKQFSLLTILTTSILNVGAIENAPIQDVPDVIVYSDVYGPFEEYNENIILDIHIELNLDSDMTLKEKLYVFDIDKYEEPRPSQKAVSFTYFKKRSKREAYDINLQLHLEKYLTTEGLGVEFVIDYQSGPNAFNPLYSYRTKIFPRTSYYLDSGEEECVGPLTYFAIDSTLKGEIFDFTPLNEGIEEESYYQYTNLLHFEYKFPKPFIYDDINLVINDVYNIFPHLPRLTMTYKKVQLEAYQVDDIVYITFPSQMYVEKSTNYMSMEEKEGFVPTNTFLFPSGEKENVLKTQFRLNLTRIGYGAIVYSKILNLTFGRNLFGDCSNSNFCVVGGRAE